MCPCHAATFDANGGVVSGPPPAPLPEFDVKEVEDKVYVSL
jgi:Rieske Fe-S protein